MQFSIVWKMFTEAIKLSNLANVPWSRMQELLTQGLMTPGALYWETKAEKMQHIGETIGQIWPSGNHKLIALQTSSPLSPTHFLRVTQNQIGVPQHAALGFIVYKHFWISPFWMYPSQMSTFTHEFLLKP